ncbi:MAG: ATP-binding protein [Parachlamydiales bacterium]
MKRLIHADLRKWKGKPNRKPLLIRGARQVGKTHAVRTLAESFEDFVELNLENDPKACTVFEPDLKADRILRDLTIHLKRPITPGKTLLFIDEIQAAPKAIIALRYLYEEVPDLHVIAAGSLLDFAIQQVGVPVGRIEFLYMYPLSFAEFLVSMGASGLCGQVLEHPIDTPMFPLFHDQLIRMLGEYLVIGGMPEVVKGWRDTQDPEHCLTIQHRILTAYQYDFPKYAKQFQLKYLEILFRQLPHWTGQRFKYSQIGEGYRKRELEPCLELLRTAGMVHQVMHTAGQGIPIGSDVRFDIFKTLFLDVGLTQAQLGLDLADYFLNPQEALVNSGAIAEAYVGQELLAYSPPYKKSDLFYWERLVRSSAAEVDYLHQAGPHILPIEVKGGRGNTLRSLHRFLETHPKTPYGVRFSTRNYSKHDNIHSYPLYAVMQFAKWDGQEAWEALLS